MSMNEEQVRKDVREWLKENWGEIWVEFLKWSGI